MSDDYDEHDDVPQPRLGRQEAALIRRDLDDLAAFRHTFEPEGFKGVSLFCVDCAEEHYYEWQMLGEFDRKTSSWVKTPDDIRKLGGAISCDRRFGRVFTGHNGADSYYAARGFRCSLRV